MFVSSLEQVSRSSFLITIEIPPYQEIKFGDVILLKLDNRNIYFEIKSIYKDTKSEFRTAKATLHGYYQMLEFPSLELVFDSIPEVIKDEGILKGLQEESGYN